MFKDFKAFVMRGNVIDLAVGVIIGAAFGKIVSSLVTDILTPFIGLIMGGVSLAGLKIKVGGSAEAPINLTYGMFLQALIDFLIIAAVIFVMIRMISKFRKPTEATTKNCPYCQSNISLQAVRCPHCTSQLS